MNVELDYNKLLYQTYNMKHTLPEDTTIEYSINTDLFALYQTILKHSPKYIDAAEYSGYFCSVCHNLDSPDCYYPCPTIRAIKTSVLDLTQHI